ncbi:MAG: DUF11 domain-containing protein, partial [Myxococcales bacterium]|nr:DUF11 domain-containing protein [Myxococcales bacterium]
SIEAPDTNVCPGETVQICGPEGNYSYAWSNGAVTRCITVGAGTYSLVITDLAGGCVSDNPCSVTIVENPRPVCSIDAPDTRVCGDETVQICGPEGDYTYLWSNGATTRCINVGAGTYSLVITNQATGCVSNNSCSVTIVGDTPQIEIEKSVSPAGEVEQGALLTYTITVTNPSNSVGVQNLVIRDVLCDDLLYAGNASPAPSSAPVEGQSGTVVWNLQSLAPGQSAVFSFQARVRELQAPACAEDDRSCTNRVTVEAFCGEARAEDSAEVTTPILPCDVPGLCRLTGGGCLNEEGNNRGHKQSTFGGNASPLGADGRGHTGNEWQHVYRDGRRILFNWHSHDAHVIQCSIVPPGPCSPPAENTRADFVGTGQYSLGSGARTQDGNMVAYIIDHREGACNRGTRDEYSIIVRTGLVIGEGTIVFQTSGEIDCGNLQIHETPARLYGNGMAPAPVGSIGAVESVALLNRAVPNPFTGSMSYAYEVVGQDQPVDIGVYNVAGRLVKSLTKSSMPAGRHTATWNGTDEGGVRVASGVYFVRVRLGGENQQHRVIFLGK